HSNFAVAAVDRAGTDVLPAIAMMRGVAGGADDDGPGGDRLAADLADRRAGVLLPGLRTVHHRAAPAHPALPALEEAVVDQQGLADGLGECLAALTEIAVDLDQQPFGIDRDQHATGVDHALEVLDGVSHAPAEEVAGHLLVVGLHDEGAVEYRI